MSLSRVSSLIRPARRFAGGIASELEQASGRRRLEIEAELKGLKYFNTDPIVPKSDAGTKENPILVPSGLEWRGVGYEDPLSHQMCWFRLYKNQLTYIPDIGLYFKMQIIH